MKKECHGAARADMIVSFGWLIKSGKNGIYGFGESFGRVGISKEDIGAWVVKIEDREAKLWSWETWFGMWTTSQLAIADMAVRAPDRVFRHCLECLVCLLFRSV